MRREACGRIVILGWRQSALSFGIGCNLDVSGIAGVRPDAQIELRHLGREQFSPMFRLAEKSAEQQCHRTLDACDRTCSNQ
jgi:hypothetical protein